MSRDIFGIHWCASKMGLYDISFHSDFFPSSFSGGSRGETGEYVSSVWKSLFVWLVFIT